MTRRFIAKPNTWFDADTEAKLLADYAPQWPGCGLFEGLRNGQLDEEDCSFEEFDIVEEANDDRR